MEKPKVRQVQRRPPPISINPSRPSVVERSPSWHSCRKSSAWASPWPSPGETASATTTSSTLANALAARIPIHCYKSHRGYAVHTYVYAKRKMIALTADDIDCIVAYIVPLNLWYVLPVERILSLQESVVLSPRQQKSIRFESFREAWWLLALL